METIVPNKDCKWGHNHRSLHFKKDVPCPVPQSVAEGMVASGYARKPSIVDPRPKDSLVESNKAIESAPKNKAHDTGHETHTEPVEEPKGKKSGKKKR